LILRVSAIAGITGMQLTAERLAAIRDRAELNTRLPARPHWARKADAHAEVIRLLAEATDDPGTSEVLALGAAFVRDLLVAVGPAADLIMVSSHRRLLAHLSAGDADGVGLEMEKQLSCLHFMWRLARLGGDPPDHPNYQAPAGQESDGSAQTSARSAVCATSRRAS
jgi:DNA-binding GntR family transcriptional regulator